MQRLAIWARLAVISSVAVVGVAYGCGNSEPGGSTFDSPNLDAGAIDANFDGTFGQGDGDTTACALEIAPYNSTLVANNAPATLQFTAYAKGTTTEVHPDSWSVDNTAFVGSIDSHGLFTATGTTGGVIHVSAKYGNCLAVTPLTVHAFITDTGGLSAAQQSALQAGGGAGGGDTGFKWLYPYDKTVFPRGLRAPVLQFGGTAPDLMYLHVTSALLTYDGYFTGSNPNRITLDEPRWRAIMESAGGSDTVTVSVTKKTGGEVTGPITETWTIATGSLKGTVYYNTYSVPEEVAVDGGSASGGAILKVRPGSTIDATVFMGGCSVCHSVSSNGNVISTIVGGSPWTSGSYAIPSDGGLPTVKYSEVSRNYAFGGLTPDGKYVMQNAQPPGGLRGVSGTAPSLLYETATGQQVPAAGWDNIIVGAQMPSFSPDGTRIVFNNRDRDNPAAPFLDQGHTLSMMSFDQAAAGGPAFTGLQDLLLDPDHHLGWPAFLPDSNSVVFHSGNDFGTLVSNAGLDRSRADIKSVDMNGTVYPLSALNGWTSTAGANGPTYLPYGEGAEAYLNYEPTVLPVAVGGYYWVVFTSRRCYGNFFKDDIDPWASNTNPLAGAITLERSPRKKLWVAAIDVNPVPGQDRSHPAFYLPGQELGTGNMRAFWALDPCQGDGSSCESGDQCCGGYCRQVDADGASGFQCQATIVGGGCAHEYEKCTSASDCCDSVVGYTCVNGHCAMPPVK